MLRAVKITLKFATPKKRRHIYALLEAYRAAVNFYIRSLWNEPGKLNKETLARLDNTRLSERYKSQALKQALDIVISTKKAAHAIGKPASCPIFTGAAVLDAKFVCVEKGQKSFDLVIRLSSLHKRHRLTIPTKHTKMTRKWLSKGGTFKQGCALREDFMILWIKIPEKPLKRQGKTVGVDLGYLKMISTSDDKHHGRDFKKVCQKIARRKPGSKSKKRAYKERENYINQTLNRLPWKCLKVVGVEALSDMKRGKKKNRGKSFRKAMAPWTYRQVLNRIEAKAHENRVRLVPMPPANTSRTCPDCGTVSKKNRRGENFECVSCGYKADADHVGALNVLARTLRFLGSVESPGLKKAM